MLIFVLGTRPEIIKMSSSVKACLRSGIDFRIVHTGQHYTEELDSKVFGELGLPSPSVNLGAGQRCQNPAVQLGYMIESIASALLPYEYATVIVQGDTNSVIAASLAAAKLGIPVAHIEAGLRSDDWTMPEEMNRVITGQLAQYHFCPTSGSKDRLISERVRGEIHVVGNTIVDAVMDRRDLIRSEPSVVSSPVRVASRNPFCLLTLHRPANVDTKETLEGILLGVLSLASNKNWGIVFPIHPRTLKRIIEFKLENLIARNERFISFEPLSFTDLVFLQTTAELILTDSGGIQEESCVLGRPSITIRENTERPETLESGANLLCPFTSNFGENLNLSVEKQIRRKIKPSPCFGDGSSGQKIIELLT